MFRAEAGRVHAALVAAFGDLDVAEDAVQEAFAQALEQWPSRGTPTNPGAWITTAARRRAIDRLRREARRAGKEEAAARALPGGGTEPDAGAALDLDAGADPEPIADDQLRLVFTCCHPALPTSAQVALTLRMVCGLRTPEIARLFLVPEATMARRLVRAKAKVRAAVIPFRLPPAHLLPERLAAVLGCVYLVFTEGYSASHGSLIRDELCDEAVRLAELVVELMPEEPEARGLLALLLLQDGRRAARLDQTGRLVVLEDQDRGRWDRARLARGRAELDRAARHGRVGAYQLQAAIAAHHARAATWEATDWPAIAALYAALARVAPSPVVELNRAVAVGYAEGPEAGLAVVEAVADDARLARGHHLPATRAHLLGLLGRADEASAAYAAAIERAPTGAEADHLRRRRDEVAARASPGAGGARP